MIGRGKAEELAQIVKEHEAEKVIFENDLKPVQAYNLAKLLGVEAIDRFQLILEIFAKRATTGEAQLQVRLASLRYRLPRARESIRLARLGEQPGFMGLGRYEVDVFLEDMRRQIAHIRNKLKEVRDERAQHRSKRVERGFPTVSLAGYTSAGKTTLFNLLAEESKPVNLGLFTTLSPTTRMISLAGRRALLTDTVGFIDRLPILLVEAFHSTLEETIYADAIILLLDVHDPVDEIRRKLEASLSIIREIGASAVPLVIALNKADLLSPEEVLKKQEAIGIQPMSPVVISAKTGLNLDELRRKVADALGEYIEAAFVIPGGSGIESLIHTLYEEADSVQTFQRGNDVEVVLKALPRTAEKLRQRLERAGGRLTGYRPLSGTLN
jgi:GTP-binding protein HflX